VPAASWRELWTSIYVGYTYMSEVSMVVQTSCAADACRLRQRQHSAGVKKDARSALANHAARKTFPVSSRGACNASTPCRSACADEPVGEYGRADLR
jgi:hypothetical protein